MIKRFLKIWFLMSKNALQEQITSLLAAVFFTLGKIVRFIFFFIFLFTVVSSTKSLAGYDANQVILFFLIFNVVDITAQFFFRGVYIFRYMVISGDLDLQLTKPLPSFFHPLFRRTDILDFVVLVPLWILTLWFIFSRGLAPNVVNLLYFLIFYLNALIVAFAIHLFVCSVGVITLAIDHLIEVYRDLLNLAHFPTDIYQRSIQAILTFAVPVIIMITIPTKVLMGLLSWQWIILSFVISGIALWGSLRFWKHALTQYSSASS